MNNALREWRISYGALMRWGIRHSRFFVSI